jgi:hypothetical protein
VAGTLNRLEGAERLSRVCFEQLPRLLTSHVSCLRLLCHVRCRVVAHCAQHTADTPDTPRGTHREGGVRP